MSYTHYAFVDDVMTLTLAEGPGERGTVLRFIRGTWEAEPHEVSSGGRAGVESAVRGWRMTGERLEIELHDVPAVQLGIGPELELTLDAAPPRVSRVHRALADILLDVPERR